MKTKPLVVRILSVFGLSMTLSAAAVNAQAQKLGIASDNTESDYENHDTFSGPKSTGSQLKADNQKRESFFRLTPNLSKPWYDLKKEWNEKAGIQLGINYSAVSLRSNKVIDEAVNDKSAGSGVLDIQLGWNAVNRKKGKNKGTLYLRVNSRHGYGSGTTAMFHGLNESGYYGLPATGFRNYTIRANELNWQQQLLDGRMSLIAGKVDPTNYFNFHGLMVPWTSFLGYGSSVSGTVNWPDKGMGVVGGFHITDNFYFMGGLTDVRGDIYRDGEFLYFGENFFKGNFFKVGEVGFVPSIADRQFKKISVTVWQTDPYVSAAGADIPKAEGVAVSSHWFFNDRFAPYLRVGFSDGNGESAFYKKDLQIGHGLVFRSHDLLGTAFSIAETNIPDAKNQMTAEVYYRFQLAEHIAITPDFQWIVNPTLNPAVDSLTYFGVRVRISL